MYARQNQKVNAPFSIRKNGVLTQLEKLEFGRVTLTMPNGMESQFVGASSGSRAQIVIN